MDTEMEEARRERIMGYSSMLVPKGFGVMSTVTGIAGLIYSVMTQDLGLGVASSGLIGFGAFTYNVPRLKCVQDLVEDGIHRQVERDFYRERPKR